MQVRDGDAVRRVGGRGTGRRRRRLTTPAGRAHARRRRRLATAGALALAIGLAAAPSGAASPSGGDEATAAAGTGLTTAAIAPPVGAIDEVLVAGAGQVRLTGWAADLADGEAHPFVDVYVGGPAGTGRLETFGRVDRYRPDVAAAHPGADDRGFQVVLTGVPSGVQQLCVYATVRAPDAIALLGCPTAGVPAPGPHDPVGALDAVAVVSEQAVRAVGWAFDPDQPTVPLQIRVEALQTHPAGSALLGGTLDPCVGTPKYCSGTWPQLHQLDNDVDGAKLTLAADLRSDVAAAHPGAGPAHGYDHTVTRQEYRPSPLPFDVARLQPRTPTRVCVWAVNVGPGWDSLLGCRWVDIPAPAAPAVSGTIYVPRASSEPLAAGEVAVEGWAWAATSDGHGDASGLRIQVSVDGPAGRGAVHDLGPITGADGSPAGFRFRLGGQAPGTHQLCGYVVDLPRARTVLLSCWKATVG